MTCFEKPEQPRLIRLLEMSRLGPHPERSNSSKPSTGGGQWPGALLFQKIDKAIGAATMRTLFVFSFPTTGRHELFGGPLRIIGKAV